VLDWEVEEEEEVEMVPSLGIFRVEDAVLLSECVYIFSLYWLGIQSDLPDPHYTHGK
jgi:hypothetical protein